MRRNRCLFKYCDRLKIDPTGPGVLPSFVNLSLVLPHPVLVRSHGLTRLAPPSCTRFGARLSYLYLTGRSARRALTAPQLI